MKRSLIITSAIILLFFNGCQRDDICPDATQTTPNLLIEFYDIQNRDQKKSINNLNASAEGIPGEIFDEIQNGNSISIPLRTDSNTTEFALTLNANADSDSEFQPNSDSLTVSYGVNEVYVGRACGYKVQFLEFNARYGQEDGDTNWIEDIQVQQPNNIKNEQNAHLYIYF